MKRRQIEASTDRAVSGTFRSDVRRPPTTGWTLIVGGCLAHAIQNAARTALENTFAVPDGMMHSDSGFIVAEGVFTLPLTDLLTGLGLLTVTRTRRSRPPGCR